MLRRLMTYLRDRALCALLPETVALVDPVCGCLRSPDVPLSKPCPDPEHSRSTRRAYWALDQVSAELNHQ